MDVLEVSQKKQIEETRAEIHEERREEISLVAMDPQLMALREETDRQESKLREEKATKLLLDGFNSIAEVFAGAEKVVEEKGYGAIFGEDAKGSTSFMQMKEAFMNIRALSLRMANDEAVDTGDILEAIVRLGETANGYADLHRGHRFTEEGKARKEAAIGLKKIVSTVYEKLEKTIYGKVSGKKDDTEISYEDVKNYSNKTEQHLLRLADRYDNWSKHFAKQEGRERDKIKEKLELLAPFEEDIRAYEADRKLKGREYNPRIKAVIDFWHEFKRRDRVLAFFEQNEQVKEKLADPLEAEIKTHVKQWDEREKEERELSKEEVDKNLTGEQLENLNEIDQWFFRNYNNAGVIGRLFAARNHHGEIVTELFKKSKRERMFIYYLIETGKRKDAKVMDAFYSQTSYIPNLKKFKAAMLASKFKVISHMTGSYVYMNKLTDALQINRDYKGFVKDCAVLEDERIKLKKQKKKGNTPTEPKEPKELRKQLLLEFYTVNVDYRNLMLAAGLEKDKDRKEALKQRLEKKGAEAEEVRKKLFEADDRFEKSLDIKNISVSNNDVLDIKTYAGIGGTAASSTGEAQGNALNAALNTADKVLGSKWGLSNTQLAEANLYGNSYSWSSLSLISQTVAIGAALCNLYENAGNMHVGDIGMHVTQILQSMTKEGYTLWKSAETAKHYSSQLLGKLDADAEFEVSKELKMTGVAIASAAVAVSAYKTVSGGLDIRNAKKASAYFKQKHAHNKNEQTGKAERERRYEENLVRLAEMTSAHKTKFSALDTVSNTISLTSLFIPGIGALVASGLGLVTSLGTAIGDSVFASEIRTAMFDQYMDIDVLYKKSLENAANRGRPIRNEKEFKKQLRRRVAAAAGYSDVTAATDYIAKKYALFVHERLFGEERISDQKEKDAYIQLIKAFGLPYDEEKHRPDVYHLARRMSGR